MVFWPRRKLPSHQRKISGLLRWNNTADKVINLTIWQDGLEVNPSVLTGSFLVRLSPYGPFPWKRS